jgi:hypothetical protein
MTPQFRLGRHVRWLHDFDKDDVACDTGRVTAAKAMFFGTPREYLVYTVRFDRPVFKRPLLMQVHQLEIRVERLEGI